jgi:hypothetical protein
VKRKQIEADEIRKEAGRRNNPVTDEKKSRERRKQELFRHGRIRNKNGKHTQKHSQGRGREKKSSRDRRGQQKIVESR